MKHKGVDYNQLIKKLELQEIIIEELSSQLLEVEDLQKVKKIIDSSSPVSQEKKNIEDFIYNKFLTNKKDYIDLQDDDNKPFFDFVISNKTKYQINQIAESLAYKNITKYVYKKIDAPDDIAYLLAKKYKKIVYSHQTALYYWDLSDVYPHFLHGTVPNNYHPAIKEYKDQISLYRSRAGAMSRENITLIETELGNKIPITTLEKTIVDCLDPKYKIDQDIRAKLLPKYLKRPDKNLRKLKKEAKENGTWLYIQPILEVLNSE